MKGKVMNMADNKLSEIIKTSLENIKGMLDANTVIGEPITSPGGSTLIPVSKISVGYVSGGVDYVGKKSIERTEKAAASNNFGGGGGTGITLTPVAFVVMKPNGECELLSINAPTPPEDRVSQIISAIERSPELIEKLKGIFKKKDSAEEE